jgi:hypothetical protein
LPSLLFRLPNNQNTKRFHSRKEQFFGNEVKWFPDSNQLPAFHRRMEFHCFIGMPKANFDVFVLFGVVSSMKRL